MIIYCGVGDCIHNECNYCETETVEIKMAMYSNGKVRPEYNYQTYGKSFAQT